MEHTTHLRRAAVRDDCTKDTCPASASIYGYAPDFHLNTGFAIGFATSAIIFYSQGLVWKRWRLFSFALAAGCFMEVGGYIGRVILHHDPFSELGFNLNMILLTIAPAFISAGIYVTLVRIVSVFGQSLSRLTPNAYAIVFISADCLSIALQGVGGGISAVAEKQKLLDAGVDILIVGLSMQILTLLVFFGLCFEFALRCMRRPDKVNQGCEELLRTRRFLVFLGALMLAFLCTFTRCCYRVAELSGGWANEIMRNESHFVILDSIMCTVAVIALSVAPPGAFFREPSTRLREVEKGERDVSVRGGDSIELVCQYCRRALAGQQNDGRF